MYFDRPSNDGERDNPNFLQTTQKIVLSGRLYHTSPAGAFVVGGEVSTCVLASVNPPNGPSVIAIHHGLGVAIKGIGQSPDCGHQPHRTQLSKGLRADPSAVAKCHQQSCWFTTCFGSCNWCENMKQIEYQQETVYTPKGAYSLAVTLLASPPAR